MEIYTNFPGGTGRGTTIEDVRKAIGCAKCKAKKAGAVIGPREINSSTGDGIFGVACHANDSLVARYCAGKAEEEKSVDFGTIFFG